MLRYRKNLPNNKGFTLIELLVVIALLIIVTGFTVANFDGVGVSSKSTIARDACVAMWDKCDFVVKEYNKGTYDGIIPSAYINDPKKSCYWLFGSILNEDGTTVKCQVAQFYHIDDVINRNLTADDDDKYYVEVIADADNNIHTAKISRLYYNYKGAIFLCTYTNSQFSCTKTN